MNTLFDMLVAKNIMPYSIPGWKYFVNFAGSELPRVPLVEYIR